MAGAAWSQSLGEELARAFVGGCVQLLPNIERIAVSAKALGWQPLEGDMAKMLAPLEESANWQGWLVDQAPAPPFFIFISEGEFRGKQARICGIANPYAPYDEVMPHIERILDLTEPAFTESELGQRYTTWELTLNNREMWLMVTDATPMGDPGLTISAFSPSQ
jgi:hypothetical protein